MTVHAWNLDHPGAVAVPAAPSGRVARAAERPALRLVRADETAAAPRLRITARGRLLCTLLAFGAVSLMVLMMWARVTAPVLPATHAVTVQPGQSLSQIAAAQLPMVPVEAAVVRIQIANGLNTSAVAAGQALVIPGAE